MGNSSLFLIFVVVILNVCIWMNWYQAKLNKEEGQAAVQKMKSEAVNRGYAEFIPNKDGTEVEFRWREKAEK